MTQIELHKKIDKITQVEPNESLVDFVRELFIANDDTHRDARRYFFTKADERWLDWLWQNGLLDAIKQKSGDQTKYNYSLPELQYLIGLAEIKPEIVAQIMLSANMSVLNFNPEVIDAFLNICAKLPAIQIAKLTGMIKCNEWVKLMSKFSKWDFEYEEIVKRLAHAKEYDALLEIAEAVLSVKGMDEVDSDSFSYNPFYLNHLERTEIFDKLSELEGEYAKRAFELLLNVLRVVMVKPGRSESKYFSANDHYFLYDVDFFTIDSNVRSHSSIRENIQDLATALAKLARKLFEGKNPDELLCKKIEDLPKTQSFYHFRLFIWSLCSDVYKEQLKNAFRDIFAEEEKYYELYCPEYCHALKKSFSILDESEQNKYIDEVFAYFGKAREDKREEKMYKSDGWEILSSIFEYLDDSKKSIAEKTFGQPLDRDFKPTTGYGPVEGGMVRPKAPIALPDLNKMDIKLIVENLRGIWSPKSLYDQDKERDFLNPLNASGMGDILRQDIAKRPSDYLGKADLFFQRGELDQHYTYSFLRAFEEIIHAEGYDNTLDLEKLLDLFIVIQKSGEKLPFSNDRDKNDFGNTWLVDWGGVHDQIAEILKKLLSERNSKIFINFNSDRAHLLSLIEYLLSNSDPDVKSENIENGDDPYGHAINSVRGRALEALSLFVYLDGKKYSKSDVVKIDEKVKQIYEWVLDREQTRAVMFLFGHYFATFFYRDQEWTKKIAKKIFSDLPEKRDLFLAATEGYMSANLYEELFEEMGDVYRRLIGTLSENYTKRRYFKDLDEGLATHLALAYIHFDGFDFENLLFKDFWSSPGQKRREHFISFIGRYLLARDDQSAFVVAHKINPDTIREKLIKLWDWILDNTSTTENGIFASFGFWIGEKQVVFTDLKLLTEYLRKSLEKSGGDMDWEHGVIKRLSEFADTAPEETLKILDLYLTYQATPGARYGYFMYGNGIDALKILYGNPKTKTGVVELVDKLLVLGSSRFWDLKKVIE